MKITLVGAPPGAPDGVAHYLAALRSALTAEGSLHEIRSLDLPASGSRGARAALREAFASPGIVHVQYPMEGWAHSPWPVLWIARAARGRVARLVVTMHEFGDLHPLRRLNVRPLLGRADAIVTPSALVAQAAQAAFPSKLHQTIPIASNLEPGEVDWVAAARTRQKLLRESGADFLLGFFGSIYRAKRPELLLRVAASLESTGMHTGVVFVGPVNPDQAGLPEELVQSAGRLGLRQPLFTGYIEDAMVLRNTLAALDVSMLPYHDGASLRRSSMLACLEACLPVFVPVGPGMDEVLKTPWGETVAASGQLAVFDPSNPEEAEVRKWVGAWSPQRFPSVRPGSWTEVARLHLGLYARLAS